MSVLTFLFFYLITKTYSQCTYTPSEQTSLTVICELRCEICSVTCSDDNQCKYMTVYSGASTTTITCSGEASCSDAKIYLGTTGTYPPGFSQTNFDNEYTSASITCTAKTSCLKAEIIAVGSFSNGITINADSSGLDSFKSGIISSNIDASQIFNLICGESTKNCDSVQYTCNGGDCLCNNIYKNTATGCYSLGSYIINTPAPTEYGTGAPSIDPTQRPTSETEIPTIKPSISPLPNPTKSPTKLPTLAPNNVPTYDPTISTPNPTIAPSIKPTGPTYHPTFGPTKYTPTMSQSPSAKPTSPTKEPTMKPTTSQPSVKPSYEPTSNPATISPSIKPSNAPTNPQPTFSKTPTNVPSFMTLTPTNKPTTGLPSISPTQKPTYGPTITPICGSTILPQSNDVIICDNNCDKCRVFCIGSGQCNGVQIYSAALNTSVICQGKNSCNNMQLYVGDNNIYPNGYESHLFQRNSYNLVTIDCFGQTSCLKLRVRLHGLFKYGAEIDADSGGLDSLKDARIIADFTNSQVFNLNCGEFIKNCYASSTVDCYNMADCHCNGIKNGNLGGCALIANSIKTHTLTPTILTMIPTTQPSVLTLNPTSITPTIMTLTPSNTPSMQPSSRPTIVTKIPSINPTVKPSSRPSLITISPTNGTPLPSIVTVTPTDASKTPTKKPMDGTYWPTKSSNSPTTKPSNIPTKNTKTPTSKSPTPKPTDSPLAIPTNSPSGKPSQTPSLQSMTPTIVTQNPTNKPSDNPTTKPSNNPSIKPSNNPSMKPTYDTSVPSIMPTSETDVPTIVVVQTRELKSSFKVTIIIFTIISALLLLSIAIYYLYTNYQNKLASDDDLTELDTNIAMQIPYKKSNTVNSTISGDGVPTKSTTIVTTKQLRRMRKPNRQESYNDFQNSYIDEDDIQIITDDKGALYDDDLL